MVRTHTVVAGDTLSALALRYGTTVAELARLNQIRNVDLIRVGQVITLPVTLHYRSDVGDGERAPMQITVTGGTVAPPSAPPQCPSWWPQSACHVWPKMPMVLAVVGLGVVVLLLTRGQGNQSPRAKGKRRRRK